MKKIRRNDEVIVITGKDKGRRGKILRILGDLVYISGVNMVKKHQKPVPNLNKQGGILDVEAPIHVSNVCIFNAETEKPDRVGFSITEDEKTNEKKKVRIFKSTGKVINNV